MGGRETKDLVEYMKVNRQPLTDVWDQSNLKSASTLFVCFSYTRNRNLDRDLFCGVSSTRLLSAIHILCNSLLLKTMTEKSISWGLSRIQNHNSLPCSPYTFSIGVAVLQSCLSKMMSWYELFYNPSLIDTCTMKHRMGNQLLLLILTHFCF